MFLKVSQLVSATEEQMQKNFKCGSKSIARKSFINSSSKPVFVTWLPKPILATRGRKQGKHFHTHQGTLSVYASVHGCVIVPMHQTGDLSRDNLE